MTYGVIFKVRDENSGNAMETLINTSLGDYQFVLVSLRNTSYKFRVKNEGTIQMILVARDKHTTQTGLGKNFILLVHIWKFQGCKHDRWFHNFMVSGMIIGFLNGKTKHNNTQIYKTVMDEAEFFFLTD